ncbi:hypothetical protein [Turkeypox virus]|uniref:Uncharacterized protein n=1 Tax=Turkeypox virus TaxID=336486 RepID=A0A0M3ZJJ1_9POXV|nr:hypothetical protein ASN15_gp041 [Turkeypox virus]ALA62415.1 hypothetical protein [Turkeypox virus]
MDSERLLYCYEDLEDYTQNELNTILKYDGISPCYFGKCTSSNVYPPDMSLISYYNIEEMCGLYTKFLEDHHILFVETSLLDPEVLDHIMSHFIAHLDFIKHTKLNRKAICKKIINKEFKKNKN